MAAWPHLAARPPHGRERRPGRCRSVRCPRGQTWLPAPCGGAPLPGLLLLTRPAGACPLCPQAACWPPPTCSGHFVPGVPSVAAVTRLPVPLAHSRLPPDGRRCELLPGPGPSAAALAWGPAAPTQEMTGPRETTGPYLQAPPTQGTPHTRRTRPRSRALPVGSSLGPACTQEPRGFQGLKVYSHTEQMCPPPPSRRSASQSPPGLDGGQGPGASPPVRHLGLGFVWWVWDAALPVFRCAAAFYSALPGLPRRPD